SDSTSMSNSTSVSESDSTSMYTSESMSQSLASHSTSMIEPGKEYLPEAGKTSSENSYGLMGGLAALFGGMSLLRKSKKRDNKNTLNNNE
ncbi:LPXTG cell wall anchor domain-containing protein, partial [Staphylococcus microti]